MVENLIVIKLGGSVITYKERPLSANYQAINNISKCLSKLTYPIIIVHGGGSFGHYWSAKFDMHTKPEKYDARNISIVHSSMLELNKIVTNSLEEKNLNPYGIPPISFLNNKKPIGNKIKELKTMTDHNIIPVTYGDIVHVGRNRYSILSGDVLMTILTKYLKPSKVIFAINVDGLYNNMKEKKIIKEIRIKRYYRKSKNGISIDGINGIDDVTGGMKRKFEEALKINRMGYDVLFLNGLNPKEIQNVLEEKSFKGTLFKPNI